MSKGKIRSVFIETANNPRPMIGNLMQIVEVNGHFKLHKIFYPVYDGASFYEIYINFRTPKSDTVQQLKFVVQVDTHVSYTQYGEIDLELEVVYLQILVNNIDVDFFAFDLEMSVEVYNSSLWGNSRLFNQTINLLTIYQIINNEQLLKGLYTTNIKIVSVNIPANTGVQAPFSLGAGTFLIKFVVWDDSLTSSNGVSKIVFSDPNGGIGAPINPNIIYTTISQASLFFRNMDTVDHTLYMVIFYTLL